jgi:hypothetical protein
MILWSLESRERLTVDRSQERLKSRTVFKTNEDTWSGAKTRWLGERESCSPAGGWRGFSTVFAIAGLTGVSLGHWVRGACAGGVWWSVGGIEGFEGFERWGGRVRGWAAAPCPDPASREGRSPQWLPPPMRETPPPVPSSPLQSPPTPV